MGKYILKEGGVVEEEIEETITRLKEKIEELEKGLEALTALTLEHEHSSPISPKCEMLLERGPECGDAYKAFVTQRQYVMCRAFKALETGEAKTLGEGIRLGWKEVHEKCRL